MATLRKSVKTTFSATFSWTIRFAASTLVIAPCIIVGNGCQKKFDITIVNTARSGGVVLHVESYVELKMSLAVICQPNHRVAPWES